MPTKRVRTSIQLPTQLRAQLAAECVSYGESISQRIERLVRLGLRWEFEGRPALVAPTHWQERAERCLAVMERTND